MEKDKPFGPYTLLLLVAGVAINLLGAKLALFFNLPVFLDSIGTILSAALGGYLPGVIVGFFSNVVNSFSDTITLYYGVISVLFAMLAAFLSQRGVFKRLPATLLSALLFALIGGGAGSLLTWMLYGLNVGSGISAAYTQWLQNVCGASAFFAQLTADFAIDVLDKLLSLFIVFLALRFLPPALCARFPLGPLYCQDAAKSGVGDEPRLSLSARAKQARACRRASLRSKVIYLILATAAVLSAIALTISYVLYSRRMNSHYIDQCESAIQLMQQEIDADRIHAWLDAPETPEADYRETKARLAQIKRILSEIKYMYVYQIRPDGCHVVFDLDTPDTPGAALGTSIEFERAFLPYADALCKGEEIPPVISHSVYGWLLTVYHPLTDAEGTCVAYIAADVAMDEVISDRYVFVIKMASLLFGASVIIVAFVLWFAQRRIVTPINAMAEAANRFAYDTEAERRANTHILQGLHIDTGDEIENLYDAMAKTFADVEEYLNLIDEKSADIAQKASTITRMQNNIILSFADMVEDRDENTGGHIRRTAAYVSLIGQSLLDAGAYADVLTPDYLEKLIRSAPLHDIGKIHIPDAILNKPGRLTPEEFDVIKTHTVVGKSILQSALDGITESDYLSCAIDMAAYHHERWDGTGYPEGLAGAAIPLCARIMAVADVLDALISKRSYKPAVPFDDAVTIIREASGTQFDPTVVAAFLRVLPEIREHALA